MASRLTAERLWRIPRVGEPVAAGTRLVVPVTTYDLEANEGTTRLWLVGEGEPRPLTSPAVSSTKPVPSPDGRRLAFLRKHEGKDQVHVMPLDGGEAERLTDLPLGAHGCVWTPDGEGLVVVADVLAGHLAIEDTRKELERRKEDPVRADVTENALYRFWDTWLTGGEVPHLFLVRDGEVRDLTPASERWMRWPTFHDPAADVAVSPDGREVAFCADISRPPHRQPRIALFTVDLDSGDENCLTPDIEGHCHRPRYTPDGSRLYYGRQLRPEFYADRVRIAVFDRRRRRHDVLTEGWDRSAGEWVPSDDGGLVLTAEDRGRQPLWRMAPDGSVEVLADDGTLSGPTVTADGRVLALHSSLLTPPEVVEATAGEVRPVTDFTREATEGLEMGTVEELAVPGAEGTSVQVLLVHPPEPASSPPPLVHIIHGGPHGMSGDGWPWRWNAAAFAAPGYLVALVNFHGSTSWGEDFTTSIHGAWGDKPAADVEAATDFLVEQGLVDGGRMAITGGSYGGYLVAWLTSQTDRYRCAVAHAAVTNLPGMYASDVTSGREIAYGAEVFEDLERVNRWSPAAHAAGYSTPTLVVHGGRDQRVPVAQGLELYGVLKAKGIEARLVHYPDENHWVLSPANSIHWYGEVLGWLDRHFGAGE